ncbi:MAG: hypothetical protein Q7V05_16350 [Methanoregula sp.]|nr:hypothetical protein [Methanoregula sp.]
MAITERFPKSIQVSVSFYDPDEERKLLAYPTREMIQQVVSNPFEIPTSEFLTYYLFDRSRVSSKFYSDYRTIGRYIGDALGEIRGFIDFNSNSICTSPAVDHPRRPVSQYIGESIGLSVVSRFHGLIEADWVPITEGRLRTFDYQIASTGKEIIQVEAKGSSVEDNREQSPNVQMQKNRMDAKKNDLNILKEQGKDPHPADLRYGTITVIDPRQDGLLKCWLTDPDPEPIKETAERLRLLSRMKFLRDWIAFISPRSQFASALTTRLGCLENVRDPNELNGIQLKRTNGEPFVFAPMLVFGHEASFFANKSRIINGSAGGVVVKISNNELFFLGIQEKLLALAAKQNFATITGQTFSETTEDKEVECVFSLNRFRELGPMIPESISLGSSTKQYIRFSLKGQLHFNASGLVFGTLPLS